MKKDKRPEKVEQYINPTATLSVELNDDRIPTVIIIAAPLPGKRLGQKRSRLKGQQPFWDQSKR